jgi:hypothetical protein
MQKEGWRSGVVAAAQPGKIPRIGVLMLIAIAPSSSE